MHVHLRTHRHVVEHAYHNVKYVLRVCRCGDRKHVQTVTLANPRYRTTQVDERIRSIDELYR